MTTHLLIELSLDAESAMLLRAAIASKLSVTETIGNHDFQKALDESSWSTVCSSI